MSDDYRRKLLDQSTQDRREFNSRNAMKGVRAAHHFTIFRIGMDACAKCGKTRAEHLTT